MNAVPDVSVIVAVYNTMPYLTRCLTSLVEQSIGPSRMEIIAIDDGSTDGSGKELDGFAERYPGTVTVIYQPNSGGPAAPNNRALDRAAGRYIYFVGADDYLGEEVLERLVKAADAYDSDVVIGKMVGINGRYVHEPLFASTEFDIGLATPALAWSLSNCKLFRRELVERHGLRFREDMPVCSDQPFTIEACARARRISVLADYDYYHAVRRVDSSNITFRTSPLIHLACGLKVMRFAAGLLEPGPARDNVLRRHFTWELAKLLGDDFPNLDRAVQEELCAGIADAADEFLTDAIQERIDVKRRVRLALARLGAVDDLCTAIRLDTEGTGPPICLDGGRVYFRYPGFGDERLALPAACFAIGSIGGNLMSRIAEGLETSSVGWARSTGGGKALAVNVRAALVGPSALDPAVVRVVATPLARGKVPAARRRREGGPVPEPVRQVTREVSEDSAGTDIRALIPATALVADYLSGARRQAVRLDVDVAGTTYEIPIAANGSTAQARRWHRFRPYRISPIADENGRLVIAVARIRPGRVVTQRLRRLVGSGERFS